MNVETIKAIKLKCLYISVANKLLRWKTTSCRSHFSCEQCVMFLLTKEIVGYE